MAVVRAGDAETNLPDDLAEPPISQPVQASLASVAKLEPFALAEDYSVNETGDRATPLMIPPPAAVPIDLVQKVYAHRQALPDSAGPSAALLDSGRRAQPEWPPVDATSRRNFVASSAAPTVGDIGQPTINESTRSRESKSSKRRKYSLVAVALASMLLVGAVLAMLQSGRRNLASRSPQLTARVESAPLQPAPSKQVDSPPVAREPSEPSPQPVAAAPSVAIAPVASAPAETTRVTLELVPIDAKVNYLGRDVPGPPFVFDIPKGHRIAVEVARFGFATAKVVLDDKKPLVHFGMLREHWQRVR